MLFYSEKKEAVVKQLESDTVKGLDSAEAARRQEQYGKNKLKEKKS